MAGMLSEHYVRKNVPKCPIHGTPCVIKTGTKNNITHGKSFFICNNTKETCSYSSPIENLEATVCPQHLTMVELKAFSQKQDGFRCYYRCIYGKAKGPAWCGNVLLKPENKKLKDMTNCAGIRNIENKNSEESFIKNVNPTKLEVTNNAEKDSQIQEDITSEAETTKDNAGALYKDRSFHIPRNTRISDISECSSLDSSSSSRHSGASEILFSENKNSPTIEIISSDEESEDQINDSLENSEILNPINTESQIAVPNATETIEHMEQNLKMKMDLLKKIRHTAPDGGRKLQDNIDQLVAKLEEMRATKKPTKTMVSFPPRNKCDSSQNSATNENVPSTSVRKTLLTLPHTNQHVLQNSHAPSLFGGRMTEARLKEVGRVTKGAIETLHKSLDTCPAPTEEAKDPDGLKVTLMTHQKQAMAWLLWREKQTPSGGILADDMGLGKTLTMISLTLKTKQDGLSQIKDLPTSSPLVFSNATVIICPASLIHQWHKEIERRVDRLQLKVCIYHGANREKRIKRLADHDIVLTTYNIASIEGKSFVGEEKGKKDSLNGWLDSTAPKKTVEGPLFKIFWRRIILDEGHNIKNHKTGTAVAICHLEGESRWIVTGTPIQNQTMDLYALIKFLRVSPFDELKVWKREVDNKSSSGTKRMNSIVNSILLRRTKDQVDQKTGKPLVVLPRRSSVVHKLKLSEEESEVYSIIQNFSKNMFTKFLDSRKNAGSHSAQQSHQNDSAEMPTHVLGLPLDVALTTFGLHGVNAGNSGYLLVLVLRLRQCCAHMSLMCEPIDADLCKSEGIDLPLEEQFGNLSIDLDSKNKEVRPNELKPTYISTKIACLLSKLKELRSQSNPVKPTKSVIVSQWTRMLDTIAFHLKREGFHFEFITGSVNAKKRSDIVESFNTQRSPEVMLVSLKAGGVGLNLIGGSNLFLLDQHWNPALEDQACDRIYRVGQQNDVVIHRFLCENTVEERIVRLQERKKELAKNVLYGGKTQKLTLDDLKMIFGLH